MRYLTFIKANIKKQKGSFIGITILMLISSVTLCGVLAIWNNSNSYVNDEMDRLRFGDYVVWTSDVQDIDGLLKQIKIQNDVKAAEAEKFLYVKYEVNGKNNQYTNGQLTAFNQSVYSYKFFDKNLNKRTQNPADLSDDEVYVPVSFCSLYNAEIGDIMKVTILDDFLEREYTIKGFYEDPIMGSSMMGMKSFMISQNEQNRLWKELESREYKKLLSYRIHMFKTAESDLSQAEFQKQINLETDLKKYTDFGYSKIEISGFMLIMQNIFAGFLLVFVLVLLIVTVIIIGHSISSSIDQDYIDMGILKAIGYTKQDLKLFHLFQYITAVAIGMAIGIPLSPLLVKLVNRLIVTNTAILVPDTLPAGICAACFGAILLLLIGYINIKTYRIGKITPIKAIRGAMSFR